MTAFEEKQQRRPHRAKICSHCGGRGQIHSYSALTTYGVAAHRATVCPHCGGSGRIESQAAGVIRAAGRIAKAVGSAAATGALALAAGIAGAYVGCYAVAMLVGGAW